MENKIVQEIYDDAFSRPRDPRSKAYKEGVKAGILSSLGTIYLELPFGLGTAEADAWFSGKDEGRKRAETYIEDEFASMHEHDEVVASHGWTASLMGRKGGAAKTDKKITAVRENGKKGGRPKKQK